MSDLKIEKFGACPLPITEHDTVQLGHGSGGKMSRDLVDGLFMWAFSNQGQHTGDDSAIITAGNTQLAFTTDSFVVDPVFFPGGNIGDLAVNGTINDLAVSGAVPRYMTFSVIIEEGFPLQDLRLITESARDAARNAGVDIVAGDTKVVNKGQCDKIFINTTGIGTFDHNVRPAAANVQAGDVLLASGSIAEHGMTIMSQREGLAFELPIESDSAALHELAAELVRAGGSAIHAMRDPTRGGVAATLNEFAVASEVSIVIREQDIPVKDPVRGACEFLGIDPLHVANEGKLIVAVAPQAADAVLAAMRAHPLGANGARIGEATADDPGLVSMRTPLGTWRIVDMMVGEQLPRIC